MRSRKLAVIGCVPLAAVLVLSGCSDDKKDTGSSGGAQGSGDKQVTLKVVGWKGGPSEPANIKEINAAFEKAHPNIKIDYTYQPGGDPYTQKLNAQLLGGDAADVIMADTPNAARWSKSGYLSDLTDQPWVADLSAPVKPLVTDNGKVVGLPSELTGIGLYSNMKLLKAAGITKPPATWPELITDLNTLKAANQPGIALPDKSGWSVFTAITASAASLVFQNTPGWNQDLASGKTSFAATPGWKTATQQVADLGTNKLIDYKAQLGVDEWSQGTQDFKAGKSAFLLQGSWAMSDLAKGITDLKFSTWPGGPAGSQGYATTAVGTLWTVNAKTSQQAAAKEYLKYWSTSAALTPYLTAEAAFSPMKTTPSPALPNAEDLVAAVTAGHYFVLPESTWAGGTSQKDMQNAVQALILGKKSVDQTLEAFDSAAKG
jgi:raffinose/stachyose/melibiose transport system substrate-binding protein